MDSLLKSVKIILGGKCRIAAPVIHALGIYVVDQPDGQQFKVSYRKPELDAPQEEQRRGHFPLSRAKFFLASTSVRTFRISKNAV